MERSNNPLQHTKPVVKEQGYCKSHPSVKAIWRCSDCGTEFCEGCVIHIRNPRLYIRRAASCPECKGACIDFQHIENMDRERRETEEARKKKGRRLLSTVAIGGLLLLLLLLWLPELALPVLVIAGAFALVVGAKADVHEILSGNLLHRGLGDQSLVSVLIIIIVMIVSFLIMIYR